MQNNLLVVTERFGIAVMGGGRSLLLGVGGGVSASGVSASGSGGCVQEVSASGSWGCLPLGPGVVRGCLPLGPGGCRPPSRQTPPPQADPPRDGHCSGRYASYWNAFLFNSGSVSYRP